MQSQNIIVQLWNNVQVWYDLMLLHPIGDRQRDFPFHWKLHERKKSYVCLALLWALAREETVIKVLFKYSCETEVTIS